MTDRERFLQLLTDFGLTPETEADEQTERFEIQPGTVRLDNTPGQGYGGFFCDWTFDADGKFVSLGVWE